MKFDQFERAHDGFLANNWLSEHSNHTKHFVNVLGLYPGDEGVRNKKE